ncbi:MAG: hypothetical protein ACD_49C00041G0005 [uncultured bacterium (gcode 4)]|uniref:Uncharacterized protein n=1 Tax=uncultured bacterium (gcode 4) TaxID=1234023 RepID=K2BCD5_9BACT|nr:MAG: hypothetical protein ACD_49C00041G0005 [uncultured bacterium (gcode 4)]
MVEENRNRFLDEWEEDSFLSPDELISLFDLTQKETNILVWLIMEWMSENTIESPEITYKSLILAKKYDEAIAFCHCMIEKMSEQISMVEENGSNDKKLEKLALSLAEIKKSWENRWEVAKTFSERKIKIIPLKN